MLSHNVTPFTNNDYHDNTRLSKRSVCISGSFAKDFHPVSFRIVSSERIAFRILFTTFSFPFTSTVSPYGRLMPVILPLYCALNIRIVYCILINYLSSLELRAHSRQSPSRLVWYLCEMTASFTYDLCIICTLSQPATEFEDHGFTKKDPCMSQLITYNYAHAQSN